MLDAVRSLATLAEELGDAHCAELAREVAEQVPGETLNLMVAGQVKRGKSTLVNALLADDLMPTGALPLTGIATAIRHDAVPAIDVRVRGAFEPLRVAPVDLRRYVTEAENPHNKLGVERVDVRWPAERLRGLVLFDTPGIGSVYAHNTQAAFAALPRADAAILVVGPEPPIGSEEVEYAREVAASSEKLFVVLNKSDLAGEALAEVLEFTRQTLVQALACDVEVLPVSAARARAAQRAGGEDPQFARLEALLRAFVADRAREVRIASLHRRAVRIAERLETLVKLRESAARMPLEERGRRRQAVIEALQIIDDRARLLELGVDDDVARLQLRLEDVLDRVHDRTLSSFRANAETLASLRSRADRARVFEEFIENVVGDWRTQAIELADTQMRTCADKYVRLAQRIERSIWQAGLEAASLDAAGLISGEIAFAPAKLKLITSLVPTTGLELLIEVVVEAFPAPLRHRMLLARYDRMLQRELDAARGKLRYGVARDLDAWRRSVRETIRHSIEQARSVVLAAFDERGGADEAGESASVRSIEAIGRRLNALRGILELPDSSEAPAAGR